MRAAARHIHKMLLLGLLLLAACGSRQKANNAAPHPRIISHSPAITEILFDMGYGDHIVGVTNWCDLPPGEDIPRVGDANGIRMEAALSLQPDLIVTQSDPATFSPLTEKLPNLTVEQLRLESLTDVQLAMIRLAELVDGVDPQTVLDGGEVTSGVMAIASLLQTLDRTQRDVPFNQKPKVLFLTNWEQPIIAGDGTFINDLIEHVGGINAGKDIPGTQLWRKAKIESVIRTQPDVLIIKASPDETDRAKEFWTSERFRTILPAARNGNVFVVTEDTWLRPSSRLTTIIKPLRDMVAHHWERDR